MQKYQTYLENPSSQYYFKQKKMWLFWKSIKKLRSYSLLKFQNTKNCFLKNSSDVSNDKGNKCDSKIKIFMVLPLFSWHINGMS